MRRYRRIVWLLLVLGTGLWLSLPVFFAHVQQWLKHLQTDDWNTLSATVRNSLSYPVTDRQWLSFAIPEGSQQLRIITNAHIQPSQALTPNPDWTYALRYELLDHNGVVLTNGLYRHHSTLTAYKDQSGKLVYNNYYANRNILPLDGRLILLGMQPVKAARFLRVRLEAGDGVIKEAALRVYIPTKISEHQLANVWLRMSQEQKDNLAGNSIYPASLLSDEEKANLLKHQWQAVGPQGIDGKDYQTMTLYTRDDKEIGAFGDDKPLLAAGLQADAMHYGVIALPEGGGRLSLAFKALDGSALTSAVAADLQWFGRGTDRRWRHNAVWTASSNRLDYRLDGGLLVIKPTSPIIINAYLSTATEAERDISDASTAIKTYLADAGVDYNIVHYQQQPTALRVDVRRLLIAGATPLPQSLHYQCLNARQQVVADGELSALAQASLFDRVGAIIEPQNISDPVSYYFNLPAEVTGFRLLANTPDFLVNAYNQPVGFTKRQKVPEDAYIATDTQDARLTWFPLRAQNDDSLARQLRVQWLNGQYRPPEDDPDVLAGRYVWRDYMPQGETAARYLLTEYSGDAPRTDALASVYCALPVNQDLSVSLAALTGLRSVSPELIYLRDDGGPFSAELWMHRHKALALNLMGRQGIIRLSETALGDRPLRLNTDSGGRWLMNYQAQCHGQRYLKRRVFALNAGAGLDFVVQHGAIDEVLSARWYSPLNTVERSQIKVDIDAMTAVSPAVVSTTWTNRKQLYDIRPLPSKAMPVLHTQGQALSNGELFAIPLNSDLPAGEYRIHIALAKGSPGYVMLSQTLPGVHDQRRFYLESGLEIQ